MAGGAARIELCSRLDLDGLTPDLGLLREVHTEARIPVYAMVRPREGTFRLDAAERKALLDHLRQVLATGCDGVVLGMLQADGSIDRPTLEQAREAAGELPLTFHKAFDRTPDLHAALEDLIACGVDRVLTSGGCATALEGAEVLSQLVRQAEGRIEIQVGGGVRVENLAELVLRTGAREFHSGLDRSPTVDKVAALVACLRD